jgi:hypothetical protein
MALSPFVYYTGIEAMPLSASEEVAHAFWVSLDDLWNETRHSTLSFVRDNRELVYPCIAVGPHQLWGLTYRILAHFGEVVGRPIGEVNPP